MQNLLTLCISWNPNSGTEAHWASTICSRYVLLFPGWYFDGLTKNKTHFHDIFKYLINKYVIIQVDWKGGKGIYIHCYRKRKTLCTFFSYGEKRCIHVSKHSFFFQPRPLAPQTLDLYDQWINTFRKLTTIYTNLVLNTWTRHATSWVINSALSCSYPDFQRISWFLDVKPKKRIERGLPNYSLYHWTAVHFQIISPKNLRAGTPLISTSTSGAWVNAKLESSESLWIISRARIWSWKIWKGIFILF